MSNAKNYVHQSIAKAVFDHGTDTMFGLMGDSNLFLVDHYVQVCGGKFVSLAIEGSSVLAAVAYAHTSGKVGVATVTQGPGLTNCITALVEAVRGNRSVVLLAGDVPELTPHNPQNIDQREIVKATGAGFEPIRSPGTVAQDVAQAFYRAQVEKRPIVLNMPTDFMWQEVEHQSTIYPVFSAPSFVPEGDMVDEAIGMIASAKRPIILAGLGATDAREALIKLAERMDAPLATTLQAKDLFLGHPLNMDIFGTLSTPAAYEVIASSDCVVSFGSSLHFFTTDRGNLVKGKRVIQIDNNPTAIGQDFRPDAALVADAALTADNILYWLNEAEIPPTGFSKELDLGILTAHPKGRAEDSKPGFVSFPYALDRLNTILPENRILGCDGGRFMTEVWCRVAATDPRSFFFSTNFAAIGQGLAEAIGAGHADLKRPVVLFTGDGGFMMGGLTEFNSAVRSKLDLVVIVCNDAAYGAEHIQFRDRNLDPALSQFDWPSFAEAAKALGGDGIEVQSNDDFELALEAINNRTRPLLIDMKLDPDDVPRMRN